ncbi:MAG: hypothetical protein GF375_03280, partial [Candidatus Omnitrophica bacterium]|nr:hypothetical protein [Candidatus Omnitrophota bacterium]
MKKNFYFFVMLLSLLFCKPDIGFAKNSLNEQKLLERIEQLEQKISQQEKRISELEAKSDGRKKTLQLKEVTIDDLNKHIDSRLLEKAAGPRFLEGLSIGIGATSVFQIADDVNSGGPSGGGDITDSSYSVDLEFQKEFGRHDKAFLHIETGDGAGVEDELIVFSYVNRDADDSDNDLAVTEAWYQHRFKVLPLVLTAGKIDPTAYIDTNEYANDETTQFLGHIFRNSPTIEFPDNSGGISFGLDGGSWYDMRLIALDADSDWEDSWDDSFIAGQVDFKVRPFNREGNYRLTGWVDNRNHIEWSDTTNDKKEGYGFGLSFDQRLNNVLAFFG